ncbi:MAG: SPFH domain-containing protein [Coriobacteriaceae bacterium]|jgi:membrane protease subunit (stomatin/prohibitin family)|nr:SPFH domain-containing protein [Coriobacteriaceae bacterium]
MGLITAFTGALGGTFADQWKEIVTAGPFVERTVVSPGVLRQTNNGRGSNLYGSEGVVSNGSKIFVPESTAAFIFSQGGIEEIITMPGGYVYQSGQDTVFNGDGLGTSIINQVIERVGFGGQPSDYKQIAFVNLREIRDIKFGTRGPLVYHDRFYGTDLEILAFGTFSLKISEVVTFIRNFVPANTLSYSFDDKGARAQILSEFIQTFIFALNSLSSEYRISQLPSLTNEIAARMASAESNAGTWKERFGFEVVRVGIENIEFSPESKELVKSYSKNKMDLKAYEETSQRASDIAAQQKIAQGIQENGLGDGGGMIFGMNLAQGMSPQTAGLAATAPAAPASPVVVPGAATAVPASPVVVPGAATAVPAMSVDEQIEAVKKLKELLDSGILTQEEFDIKKKEVLGL